MVEKKEERHKSHEETYGIAGFTLGIVGLLSLVMLVLPVFISFALMWVFAFGYLITGLVFCRMQQKRHPTRAGRIGFRINLIGIIIVCVVLALTIVYIVLNFPALQQTILQAQNFPTA